MNIGRIVLLGSDRAGGADVHWAMVVAGARSRRGSSAAAQTAALRLCAVGFVTNFFDTLGIGCFAPTTAYYKLRLAHAG